LAAAYEERLPDDSLSDDSTGAVDRLRQRLAKDSATTGTKYGVVMVTGPKEMSYSSLTIPLWQAYCKKHDMGLIVQKEPLNTDLSFMWAKPRALMEILPAVKWRYTLLVDASTVPKDFNRTWEYMIKLYMRHKRYSNDEPDKRYVFCPWDCDEEYTNPYEDGACNGPILSGCILWSKKPKTTRLMKSWYAKRLESDLPDGDDGVLKGFEKMKEHNYEEVFYRDVADDVGRANSKFIPSFGWSEEYKWNIHDRIHAFIKKNNKLAVIANKASKENDEL